MFFLSWKKERAIEMSSKNNDYGRQICRIINVYEINIIANKTNDEDKSIEKSDFITIFRQEKQISPFGKWTGELNFGIIALVHNHL